MDFANGECEGSDDSPWGKPWNVSNDGRQKSRRVSPQDLMVLLSATDGMSKLGGSNNEAAGEMEMEKNLQWISSPNIHSMFVEM